MSYVNGKNRQRVYSKWNETYPNQLANEVEVYVANNGNSNRRWVQMKSLFLPALFIATDLTQSVDYICSCIVQTFNIFFIHSTNDSLYRTVPKKNRPSPNKPIQLNNQIPQSETAENAPDYLPYSMYSKLEQLQQKAREDTIHPNRSPQAASPKLPSQKPKKRHSRPLKLTGEVNLGTNKFNSRDRKQRPQKPVDEVVTNAGRHHHHPNEIAEVEEEEEATTTTMAPTTTTQQPTTEKLIVTTTTASASIEAKRKLDEKALRRERLKQKLAALTPQERQAFLLMKQQRAEAKKKGINYAN